MKFTLENVYVGTQRQTATVEIPTTGDDAGRLAIRHYDSSQSHTYDLDELEQAIHFAKWYAKGVARGAERAAHKLLDPNATYVVEGQRRARQL